MTHPTDSSHIDVRKEKILRLARYVNDFRTKQYRGYNLIITLTKEDFEDIVQEGCIALKPSTHLGFMGYDVKIGDVTSIGIQINL